MRRAVSECGGVGAGRDVGGVGWDVGVGAGAGEVDG